MKTHHRSIFRRSVVQIAIASLLAPTPLWAAPLSLSTTPAGTSSKAPAPNVIVSVDDSGSMKDKNGIGALRAALLQTFSETNVPDGSIRLAWQSMNGCFEIPSASCNDSNVMKVFKGVHRQNFKAWVNTLKAESSTPSHRMYRNAGNYYANMIDVNSAWASDPGKTLEPVLSCRRSYNLFMTDGGWNNNTPADNLIGDYDNTSLTLPDGVLYDTNSASTKIFRGEASGQIDGNGNVDKKAPLFSTTMSDLAFYYWATDLQRSMANDVKPLIKAKNDVTFTTDKKTGTIPEYWNPRNDVANWQHMTTYTVGFNDAANWKVKPIFGTSTWTDPLPVGNKPSTKDYSKLMLGETNWPNPVTGSLKDERITELWHMALNSRGKFIPAPNAQSLVTAFQDILNEIISDNSTSTTSVKGSASNLRFNSTLYAAGYDALNWTGQIIAYGVEAGTGTILPEGQWGSIPQTPPTPAKPKSTATIMDDPSFNPATRVILTSQSGPSGGAPTGIPFQWTSLSTAKQVELKTIGGVVDNRGEDRLNFIRGDRTLEAAQAPVAGQPENIFRDRVSRHGDIVNSDVWFTPGLPEGSSLTLNYKSFQSTNASRKAMLYVGANDGMLHGFDAETGVEKIAYVPDGLNSRLSSLTAPSYTHAYFVDGSPFTGDVFNGTAWKTYLAGFPGMGGKGYFVLDVTNPAGFSAANAANTVVLDTTGTNDPDIGRIVSQPVLDQTNDRQTLQLTQMNNGRWALVTGNGINSTNERAALLIQYVDGAKELLKLIPSDTSYGANAIGGGNGLSAPRLIDLNGDAIPDVAYAGDLLGNLWKFDLTDPSHANWRVAFSDRPLFVAKDAYGAPQPITTTPGWIIHPDKGLMIAFGTGRNFTDNDRVSEQQNTLYGIHDPTTISIGSTNAATGSTVVSLDNTNNAVVDGRASLVKQSISENSTATTANGADLWTTSSTPVSYSASPPKKGWFLELPDARERATRSMDWFRGRTFGIPTNVPDVGGDPNLETCDSTPSAGKRYMTYIDILNGSPPAQAIFSYGTPPAVGSTVPNRVDDRSKGNAVYWNKVSSNNPIGEQPCGSAPGAAACDKREGVSPLLLRPTWRQAQ